MKNIFYIFILLCMTIKLDAQVEVRPVCDDALEIPYQFTYNGFILFDDGEEVLVDNGFRIKLDVVEGSEQGNILYSETKNIPFSNTGYFSFELGASLSNSYKNFLNYLNDNTGKSYFIDCYFYSNSLGDFKHIGSSPILTVPYAMVANALGGMGNAGTDGSQGPQGPQGPAGPQGIQGNVSTDGPQGNVGETGYNGFGFKQMTNTPPTDESFYIDDGTNTVDGQPHVRYRLNGIWIDL